MEIINFPVDIHNSCPENIAPDKRCLVKSKKNGQFVVKNWWDCAYFVIFAVNF